MIFRGLTRLFPHSFIMFADMPSGPWAFLMSRFNKRSLISSSVTINDDLVDLVLWARKLQRKSWPVVIEL